MADGADDTRENVPDGASGRGVFIPREPAGR